MSIQHFGINNKSLQNTQSGVILPAIVLVMLALTISALALASFTINQLSITKRQVFETGALLTAEAGAEQTLNQLNINNNFSGYSTEQEFFNNNNQGKGTYTTSVTNGSLQNEKIITSTGKVYRPYQNSSNIIRKVRIIVVGTTPTTYAVQAGSGGLDLLNIATISNGDVYVNGKISMANFSRIGSSSTPVNVNASNYSCPQPANSTYPAFCSSGQPISVGFLSAIYGNVCATNQTNGSGMFLPGLQSNCVSPPISLPSYDRQSQVNSISNTTNSTLASCTNIFGNKTWSANTHITGGNVNVSSSCTVTIQGNVWIDGNLTLSDFGIMKIADGISSPPVIMIDGSSGFDLKNLSIILPNNQGVGARIITYYSSTSCSPNCTDVTGTDLANSQNIRTIYVRNIGLAPGTTFYARWSKVTVTAGGSIGSVSGQKVELNVFGNVSFGSQLSSGTSVWSIKNYQQIFE